MLLFQYVPQDTLLSYIDLIKVPDTSRVAALNLAQKLKLPYREGFIKNRYVGRTFIMPGQQMRYCTLVFALNLTVDACNVGRKMFGGSLTLWLLNFLEKMSSLLMVNTLENVWLKLLTIAI